MPRNDSTLSARFEDVLDIYGGDPTRWPADERQALLRHADADAQARGLLAQAQALDRMLAHAPSGSASEALTARIMAGAVADGAHPARVVPLRVARARPADLRPARNPRAFGPAAALLAASFVFGVYIGAAGVADLAFDTAFGPVAALEADGFEQIVDPTDGMLFDQEELL